MIHAVVASFCMHGRGEGVHVHDVPSRRKASCQVAPGELHDEGAGEVGRLEVLSLRH